MTILARNNSTAHSQRQSNRRLRKREHPETVRNSKPSKVLPALSTHRQPGPLILTPPLTEELTPRADTVSHREHHNYDHLWTLIRERKIKQLSLKQRPIRVDADELSAYTGETTPTQAKKEQQRFAEEVLHPRWIAIRRDQDLGANSLSRVQKIVREALDGNIESTQHSPDFKSIIGDELFASIDEGQEALIKSWLSFLKTSKSSEAQWESRLWRRWFLKDTSHTPPNRKPSNSKPFMGQIVQAQMSLSSDGSVIPPLLASGDARRESRRVIAPVPWHPNLKEKKAGHVLWYLDYLYAVSQSSLELRFEFRNIQQLRQLPAFRLAQKGYLPGNWLAEIKDEDADAKHLAAENYSALMSAFLLHERLLLHWIAKNDNAKSNNPVKLDDSLAIHCITCCGEVCKIWRMSIRIKETSSDLEPVRYDMRLLDTFDIELESQRLCDWINALNALALTAQFEGIIEDLKEIYAYVPHLSPEADQAFLWTSRMGFVYKAGSGTEICVAPLSEIHRAYSKGKIVAEQPIGDKVVDGWDKEGRALEVEITPPEVPGEGVPESSLTTTTICGKCMECST